MRNAGFPAKKPTPCEPKCLGPWVSTGNRSFPMKRCTVCGKES